ncbi:MAG: transcriptional regulator LysR family [Gammaproteobacteria bacterium]|jgi:DNA-binding transcriptional LysR family regulator|nr:transcriptional regulator LysR family [Gammaproteobacteria bacterium]
MRISLKQIEIFLKIAKLGNMSQAAQVLGLSQSACSMALAALESQLNGILFDRSGKRLNLNERGRVLLPMAINLIAQATNIQEVMLETNSQWLAGELVVGASTTIGNYLMPHIVGNFVLEQPRIKVNLQVANTEQIVKQLLNFNIDIGLIEGDCNREELELIPWRQDKLIIIAAAEHQLAKKAKLTANDLEQARWVLREIGSGTRQRFESAFPKKVIPFLELGSIEAVKQVVHSGLAISCIAKIAVTESLKSGQLVELKTPFLKLTRDFSILLHKEKYQTAVLKRFIQACLLFKVNHS